MRSIFVSRALSAQKALNFKSHLEDLFDGEYVFPGLYAVNGNHTKFPFLL